MELGPMMTYEQILESYPDQWVFVVNVTYDEGFWPIAGQVAAFHTDRARVDDMASNFEDELPITFHTRVEKPEGIEYLL